MRDIISYDVVYGIVAEAFLHCGIRQGEPVPSEVLQRVLSESISSAINSIDVRTLSEAASREINAQTQRALRSRGINMPL